MTECKKQGQLKDAELENNPYNKIGKVITVMSGKGGVGKSSVASLLAKGLKKKHYKVGILDADITGPSIPRIMNVSGDKITVNKAGVVPVQTEEGILVMSFNLLMEDEEHPVIWRGPKISNAIKQFWSDVYWGSLDYLIVDLPPGTGDVALTIMQSYPVYGTVIVSTPQDMVSMIVAKSIKMARTLNIPVIGIIENMSYLECPECRKKVKIFESEKLNAFLKKMDIKLLGELPMCREIASLPERRGELGTDLSKTFEVITKKIVEFEEKNHKKEGGSGI